MTVRCLKQILENCRDDADIMLVVETDYLTCMIDDLVAFAPSDGSDSISEASGIYFYGDSCDFLEDDNDC